MNRFYYSIYGPYIEKFIQLKRTLGFKYGSEEKYLYRFDIFAEQNNETVIGISLDLANKWGAKTLNETDSNRYARIGYLRQFSSYLCQLGYSSYVPKLPKINRTYTPYIFSKEEICLIFETCDRLKETAKNLKSAVFVIPALFRLLYATGIRISEAISLSITDVNLQEHNLILRNCKNGKDRLIPFTGSLADVLKDYLGYRSHCIRLNPDPIEPFFLYLDGGLCSQQLAYSWFRKVLYKAGIPHRGKGLGPRLYDLRHTFSIHSLASMSESGLDLYYSLPILSTYLGHQSLAATDKYVRLTEEMYPSLIANVNKLCPYLFPESNFKIQNNETN